MIPNSTSRRSAITPPRPPPGLVLTRERRRGRLILLIFFGFVLLYHLLAAGLSLALRIEPPLHALVRLAFFFALMLGTYFGQNFAKWLLIIIASLASLGSGFDLFEKPSAFTGFLFFFCILPPAILLFSKSVNSFLDYQSVEK